MTQEEMPMNDIVAQSTELATDIGMTDEVSWMPSSDMNLETYLSIGKTFQQIQKSIAFWMGDWLCYGENRFGEAYSQALENTGRQNETLIKWRSVAARVPRDIRRKELSWTHTFYVAYCTEYLRGPLLDLAVNMNLSSRELKDVARLEDNLIEDLITCASEGIEHDAFMSLVNRFKLHEIDKPAKPEKDDDEDEEELPFSDLGDDGKEDASARPGLDPETVTDWWENAETPMVFCGPKEAIWQGLMVTAGVDRWGNAILIWETVA